MTSTVPARCATCGHWNRREATTCADCGLPFVPREPNPLEKGA